MTDDAVTPSFPVPAVIPMNGAPRSRLLSRILGPKQQFLTPGQLRDRISEIEAQLPALCEEATAANYAALDGSGSEAVAEEYQQRVDRAEAELRRCRSALPAAEKRLAEQQAEDHAKLKAAADRHRHEQAKRIREAAKALSKANMEVWAAEERLRNDTRRRHKASEELKSLLPGPLRDALALTNGKLPDVSTPEAVEKITRAFLTGELPAPRPPSIWADAMDRQLHGDAAVEARRAREEERRLADAANLRKILEELGLAAVTGESPS